MASRPVEAYHSLRDVYNTSHELWKSHPILGLETSGISGSLISVQHVPDGRSTPYWFDEDGDLHTFMKLYMLKP
jgi:hypothetical protein